MSDHDVLVDVLEDALQDRERERVVNLAEAVRELVPEKGGPSERQSCLEFVGELDDEQRLNSEPHPCR